MAGFGGALAALLVFLLSLPRTDWIALTVAVVVGALLTGWELRASRPFFDVRLLARNQALNRTYLRWAVLCLCIYTVLYGVTEWLQAGRGLSPLDAGLLLLPMSAVAAVIAFGYLGSIASSAIIAITFRTSVSDHGLHVTGIIMVAVSALALVLITADRHLMSMARARPH